MYAPKHFAVEDRGLLSDVVDEYPFGMLISATAEEGPYVSHLPWLLDRSRGQHGVLRAHMAKANPHWQRIHADESVLAVFQGPHDYVSPAWYAEDNLVPTWNYVAVHARGRLKILDSTEARAATVSALTLQFEARRASPWQLDLDSEPVARMLDFIVAFEIEIESLTGKFKLSQNRGTDNKAGVIAALADSNPPLAAYMRKC